MADFSRKQAFEKMVSGMYLGEITRNILLFLIDSSELFEGHATEVLNTHYGFDTAFVSIVEGAKTDDDVAKAITDILMVEKKNIKPTDIELVRWACHIVAHRAASLAATAVAAVILHTAPNREKNGQDEVDLGVDGR